MRNIHSPFSPSCFGLHHRPNPVVSQLRSWLSSGVFQRRADCVRRIHPGDVMRAKHLICSLCNQNSQLKDNKRFHQPQSTIKHHKAGLSELNKLSSEVQIFRFARTYRVHLLLWNKCLLLLCYCYLLLLWLDIKLIKADGHCAPSIQ